jgi:hypothetical protein
MYRPGQEQRTVSSSSYQLSVQKNGRIDVLLFNGSPVFENAYPAVLFEGEDEWTELDIGSRFTFREQVNDVLGQGHALIMARGNCEWALHTYTTQPFFTVQAAFVNTEKKPVRVRGISAWSTGDSRKPGGLLLGGGGESLRAVTLGTDSQGYVQTQLSTAIPMESRWHIAVADRATGRSLIAGVLGLSHESHTFALDRLATEAGVTRVESFVAAATLMEPVTIEPGGRLETPVLYFGVSEANPIVGLRRFGQALARVNDVTPAQFGETMPSASFFAAKRPGRAALAADSIADWDGAAAYFANTARLFHLAGYFWTPVPPGIAALSREKETAVLLALAMTGNEIPASHTQAALAEKFVPVPNRAAQPLDLFERELPRVFTLPMDNEGGHVVVGLFNWDDTEASIPLEFGALGLAKEAYYTVYDPLREHYLGSAADRLAVAVPPESVQLLSLRRRFDWPTVLADGGHFTTASSGEKPAWDSRTNTLSGTAAHGGVVRLFVPPEYQVAESSSDVAAAGENPSVVTLDVSGDDPVAWSVRFERTGN